MDHECTAHPGRWWSPPLEDGRIRCDLCPRHCKLSDGQRAFCFVRKNLGGKMKLTTYGRSTGFCVDPIEKKPLNHFYPGSSVLSFGTAGCNLGCRFCQNWDISKAREVEILSSVASPDAIARTAQKHGCKSVAFTYNDPVIFAEYAIDTAKACHQRDLRTVAVTAGYITPQARNDFFEHLDAVNVDLKAFAQTFYEKLCFAKLAPVLETLQFLRHKTSVWLEVTTLLIPGQNDSEQEVDKLCQWFYRELGAEVPLHFSAFHPDFKMQDIPPTPAATLTRARQQAIAHGLKHVYTGNVHDPAGQSTFCANCNALLIERDWYTLGRWQLDADGRCRACGYHCAGHFAAEPGSWGAKRLPIYQLELRNARTQAMALSRSELDISLDAASSDHPWVKQLLTVLPRALDAERDQIHPALAAVITQLKEAHLSATGRSYTALLAACFVAHMEFDLETPYEGLAKLLARAYQDLQLAIQSGEIPDNLAAQTD